MSKDRRQPRDRRREMELEAQRVRAQELGLDRYLEYRDNARLGIIRRAAIYVPSGLVLTGLLAVAIVNLPNSIVAVIVLAIFSVPVDMEATQAVRDLLRKEPVTSRGVIDRQWAKSRFMFVGRVRYLLVDLRRVEGQGGDLVDPGAKAKGTLFEIEELTNHQLHPGDEIEVVHWPHTNAIVSLELLSSGVDANKGAKASERPNKAWEELDRGPSGNTNPWTGL
ncbi:MAG: hypothetical protein H6674_04340 [Dehalococcoidia bacterium]|nr:hypothetical protein [Dehalococcoidia bacterium]MCB9482464.1 hypothetical protein [Dehalococcoidia bacterium]MCB9491283.1 hypothetical protein [Dehalococcoidia bacterium]